MFDYCYSFVYQSRGRTKKRKVSALRNSPIHRLNLCDYDKNYSLELSFLKKALKSSFLWL